MASALGIVVVSALWWLYFDVAAILERTRLMQATGVELHRLALYAYSYLHLPMIAGIVLFALGSGTSHPSTERPAGSSAGGRSGRSCCWLSSQSRSWSRHSRHSAS